MTDSRSPGPGLELERKDDSLGMSGTVDRGQSCPGQHTPLWRNQSAGRDLELPTSQVAFDGLIISQCWDSVEVETAWEGWPEVCS